ncbi:MAG: putative transposase [Gammaproteobacteria bacterium]|jgi:hypothetical protein|nr:putative transposase [Gammaproteobacteria bacterium]
MAMLILYRAIAAQYCREHGDTQGDWPYLWIDATYVKVREAGRIVSVAVINFIAHVRVSWRQTRPTPVRNGSFIRQLSCTIDHPVETDYFLFCLVGVRSRHLMRKSPYPRS